mgnify:FL=1
MFFAFWLYTGALLTNVGVGLAFFELLHIRGAIFGGEKAKFGL